MKEFWLDVLKRFLASAGVLILCGIISLILFSWVFSLALRPSEREVPKDAVLVIDLTMNLTDRPASFDFEHLAMEALSKQGQPRQFHLLEVTRAIRKAAKDEGILAILLKGSLQPSGYGCGYAALAEYRNSQ